ncbi:MAG: hypothetical protein KAI24_23665 [Planctomycetes bacterium]|nr:hypothetical protein [Planctomycetota bacterium]
MKRFPLLLAALIGVAVSVPAQNRRHGRHPQGQVVTAQPAARGPVSQQAFRRGQPIQNSRPTRRGQVIDRGSRGNRGFGRRGHGHWETRCERVLVPGYWDRQHVPAVYGWIYSGCGHRHWGIIKPACFESVWIPARWETRSRRVWVCH